MGPEGPARPGGVVLALLACVALAIAPSAAAAKGKGKFTAPDLTITKVVISELPGTPPYIVVGHDGHSSGFVVRVVTTNVGTAKSNKSQTELAFLHHKTMVASLTKPVPELLPHKSHPSVFTVDSLDVPLGWLTPRVTADSTDTNRRELKEDNNVKELPIIPVIARVWNVTDFMTTLNGAGGLPGLAVQSTKTLAPGAQFVFSRFDEAAKQFVYIPEAGITVNYNYVYAPVSCAGSASGSPVPLDPWPGYLRIDDLLDSYDAIIEASKSTAVYHAVISCMGTPIETVGVGLQDLITMLANKERPSMQPSTTTLTGLTTQPGIELGSSTTWQWTFKADVPR